MRTAVVLFSPKAMNGFFIGGFCVKGQYDRQGALTLLQNMHSILLARGESRYPQRSDFSPEQVVAIKAFLGPWPRALEAAGLKPARDDARAQKQLEKRILQRRRARQAKIDAQNHPRDSRA